MRLQSLFLYLCLAGFPIAVFATNMTTKVPQEAPVYAIDRSITHTLRSSVNQLEYEIYIRLPKKYSAKTESKYPIVVLNDSGFSFPLASGITQLMGARDHREAILVGISYSLGDKGGTSRTRDYTPTFAPNETSYHSLEARQVSGQADKYLQFIEKDVFPFLIKHYRVDMQRKIFVGHSFGGLLGAFTLLSKPQLFDHYIIGSPSLWYDNKVMFELEKQYAREHKAMAANVHMYIGGEEDGNVHTMVKDLRAYEQQLRSRNYKGLTLSVDVIDGASHHSAFSHLLTLALPKVLPL